MPARPNAVALEQVIAAMAARQEELGGRLHAELTDRVPSYRAVPRELLDQIWHRHFQRALEVLREGRVPAREELDEADVARDRASRGVPLDDGLRAFRHALSAIRDLFIAEATSQGLDPGLIVECTKNLWELADIESLQIATVHRQTEVAAALFDARRRADFLRGLLYGTLSTAQVHSGAAIYGLDPSLPYRALRAVPSADCTVDRLERTLDAQCRAHGCGALLAVLDEGVAGVVKARPQIGDLEAAAGLGPPMELGAVHRSFRAAGRLLDAARAYGLRGVYDLGDLSWRVAVVAEPELAELLLDRYLSPLEAEGEFGLLIEESVRRYFEAGRRIAEAARTSHVHVNTIRYRLRRFEELTGTCLDAPDTAVELSWALAARTLRPAVRFADRGLNSEH
ncbi:PucR family transcriptional regulator [Streptantibioticus rubrisoli]|uniref:Helix-turn-helix domain-containing protein n=1 Tax=Streptantibioticus rubrisoli TaxID=1387313 RepID=A0ABT1PM20_9ACTN|nr:helix-turn-helix domain-containing protein [Streptantibioticus rubrisoli]MCQ4045283.1 helix-turn-helix domain-containing protein [Streptantibioticus rubrisoli]